MTSRKCSYIICKYKHLSKYLICSSHKLSKRWYFLYTSFSSSGIVLHSRVAGLQWLLFAQRTGWKWGGEFSWRGSWSKANKENCGSFWPVIWFFMSSSWHGEFPLPTTKTSWQVPHFRAAWIKSTFAVVYTINIATLIFSIKLLNCLLLFYTIFNSQ